MDYGLFQHPFFFSHHRQDDRMDAAVVADVGPCGLILLENVPIYALLKAHR
jgi:hypothetical protein